MAYVYKTCRITIPRHSPQKFISMIIIPLIFLILSTPWPVSAAKEAGRTRDLTELPLQELMEIEVVTVYGASKFEQKLAEAPASVSIVTSSDIRRYGYRTLADILRSVRGFYTTYDRNYHYIGMRGFSRAGDYNSRFLLLVDGHRVNENIYNQAPVGTDFPLDVDLIDRVEVIRGPSSSIYGTNAFMGVINVISRRGGSLDGMEVSGETSGDDTYKGRISFGRKFENGMEAVVSGSNYGSRGKKELYYENLGTVRNADADGYQSLFSTLQLKGLRLQGAYISRDKTIPTAPWDTEFGNSGTWTNDERAYLDLKYEHSFSEIANISSTLYYDHYQYRGYYQYTGGIINRDDTVGRWWGGDLKFTTMALNRHKIIAGAEFVDNFQQDQINYDDNPYNIFLDDRRNSRVWALYVQDEFTILENLILNLGLRHDQYDTFGGTTNPRAALIYRPFDSTTLKFLYGTAFRAPNPYEIYDSPDIKPERIETYEWIVEQSLREGFRLTASLFLNKIDDLISMLPAADGVSEIYKNVGMMETAGAELELEKRWAGGIKGLIGYTYQETKNRQEGEDAANSPKHLIKANLMLPLLKEKLFAGIEEQYTSERLLLDGSYSDSFFMTNVTLSAHNLIKGMDAFVSIYNLFDKKYDDPASHQHKQGSIEQDGISFRLKLIYRF